MERLFHLVWQRKFEFFKKLIKFPQFICVLERNGEKMEEAYYQTYLDELKEIKPCNDKERSVLVPLAVSGDKAARDRLIEGHLIFALALAKDYRDKGISMSDLVQEANLALTMAVNAYQEGEFLAFIQRNIVKALEQLLEEQKKEEKTGEEILAKVNVLQEISRQMAEELGREATLEELGNRMQLPVDEIREIMKLAVNAVNIQ